MAILWLAARVNRKITGLRGICTRAVRRLLFDAQMTEMSPNQWLEVLIPVIVAGADAIGSEADDFGQRQAGLPAAAA